jgi:hypothetical protein
MEISYFGSPVKGTTSKFESATPLQYERTIEVGGIDGLSVDVFSYVPKTD